MARCNEFKCINTNISALSLINVKRRIDQGSRSRFILSLTFSYIVMVFCGMPFFEIFELRNG